MIRHISFSIFNATIVPIRIVCDALKISPCAFLRYRFYDEWLIAWLNGHLTSNPYQVGNLAWTVCYQSDNIRTRGTMFRVHSQTFNRAPIYHRPPQYNVSNFCLAYQFLFRLVKRGDRKMSYKRLVMYGVTNYFNELLNAGHLTFFFLRSSLRNRTIPSDKWIRVGSRLVLIAPLLCN